MLDSARLVMVFGNPFAVARRQPLPERTIVPDSVWTRLTRLAVWPNFTTVERTIGWIQNFRRLCIRWEKSTMLFQGFLHLGCTMLLLKEVLG